MPEEARLEETPSGLVPAGEGWFVVNVRDAAWFAGDDFGASCRFESRAAPFRDLGINVRVLPPGRPNGKYHAESIQENVLVLAGECVLVVEGQERRLGPWDFVHLPPGTAHIVVGAGEEPCVVLMTGARLPGSEIVYPVEEAAARHGASVERETNEPAEAYAGYEWPEPRRPEGWDALPWARGTT